MTEQYVLQQMKSKGVSPIYYHNTDNSRLELDFVIQRNAQMVPIEVKAEGNVRANSLTALLGKDRNCMRRDFLCCLIKYRVILQIFRYMQYRCILSHAGHTVRTD